MSNILLRLDLLPVDRHLAPRSSPPVRHERRGLGPPGRLLRHRGRLRRDRLRGAGHHHRVRRRRGRVGRQAGEAGHAKVKDGRVHGAGQLLPVLNDKVDRMY